MSKFGQLSESSRLIAFDCSNGFCEAAILCDASTEFEYREQLTRQNRDCLFLILGDLLDQAELAWQQIDAVAVGVGPGNFTGIRQGIAAARGLALALGKPAIGINRFDALAFGVDRRALVTATGPGGKFHCRLVPNGSQFLAAPAEMTIPDAANLTVIGAQAEQIAQCLGSAWAKPRHNPAIAVAHVARTRIDRPGPRPVPDYAMPPNATPFAAVTAQ